MREKNTLIMNQNINSKVLFDCTPSGWYHSVNYTNYTHRHEQDKLQKSVQCLLFTTCLSMSDSNNMSSLFSV